MKHILLSLALLLPLASMGQTFNKVKKQADAGSAEAMIALHFYYVEGVQTAVDTAAAYDLLQRAAATGNADAKGWLAKYELYFRHDTAAAVRLANESAQAGSGIGLVRQAVHAAEGIGCKRNYARSQQLLEQSANMGCDAARELLASRYLFGEDSCDYSPIIAYQYLKPMREGVGSNKVSFLADYYLWLSDTKHFNQCVDKGIKQGSLFSQYDNIQRHFYGIGVPEDEHAALQVLAELRSRYGERVKFDIVEVNLRLESRDPLLHNANQCHTLLERIGNSPQYDSYARLGQGYLTGFWGEVDTARAMQYYQRGAAKGEVGSMAWMMEWYLRNENTDSARYWLDQAIATGKIEAHELCAQAYLDGTFSERNFDSVLYHAYEAGRRGNMEMLVLAGKIQLWKGDTATARTLFQKAIDLRHFDAYANLAWLEKDCGNQHWVDYLHKGVKQGSKDCCNLLGDYYADSENYKQAERYYAQSNTPEGDDKIARMILSQALGEPTEADLARAFQLVQWAESAQYAPAMLLMAGFFENGFMVEQNYDSALYRLQQLVDMGDEKGMFFLATYYERGRAVEQDSAMALSLYHRACSAGYSLACDFVGDYYKNGWAGTVADPQTAFVFYNQAASIEEYNEYGLYDVALCYLQGVGVHVDSAKAIVYLEQAIEAGSPQAASKLADFYWDGLAGLPIDRDTALTLYSIASQSDDPRADYMIGAYLYSQGVYEKAWGYLQSALSNGSIDAKVLLAKALLNGNGIEANPEAAIDMLQQISDIDTTGEALYTLGLVTLLGKNVEADTAEGLRLIQQAIERGNTSAMITMGELYADGTYVEHDTVRAVEMYEMAARRGNTTAMMRLANSYLRGVYVAEDPQRAAEYYQMGVDHNDLDAMCRLGLCYEEGTGVVANTRRAYNLYLRAAESGSSWGMRLVAFCYAQGIYVDEDTQKAAEWMLRSAEAGDITAAYIVGQLYANGEGLKKSKKEAKKWLTIAAEAGHEGASELLKTL